jgi:putative ABC transport system permease protein
MFQNYVRVALRNLLKNKLYSAINILGLAVGLTVYLFGGILADYERNHDTMFANHERTYTIGSILSPAADLGVKELDGTYTAMGPLLEASLPEAEYVARTVRRNYLVSNGDNNFYEDIRFADPSLSKIFDFEYIVGDASSLEDPKGLIITETAAIKIFGSTDIYNQTVMLNNKDDLRVKAVIKDLPANSHFNSSIISDSSFELIAPLVALNRIDGWNLEGNWNNLSLGNLVYVMTKEIMPLDELSFKVNAIFDTHVDPELQTSFLASLRVRPLIDANAAIWDMLGMPVIQSVQILGLLVLIIAIVNYTNLAIAQSMGRTREVGMRKVLGAKRGQLLSQFLIESLTIAFIAMLISMAFLEILVPQFNSTLGKVVSLDYLEHMPWLITTAIVVGMVAGAYPSYLITKVSPADAVKSSGAKGVKGSFFRSFMISTQFVISIFMLALVMIMYFQNGKMLESSEIFPKDDVITINKMSKDDILAKEDILRRELLKHPDITYVTFASQVPFEQSNNRSPVSLEKGDDENSFPINNLSTDPDFIKTFDIPLLAGRNLSRDYLSDKQVNEEQRSMNVIINEMTAHKLGFVSVNDAVGQVMWGRQDDEGPEAMQYTIVGVVQDQNILGLHNNIKPWVFYNSYEPHFYGAIRLKEGASANVVSDIEATWKTILPENPFEYEFLDGLFEGVYGIYRTMNMVLAGFASTAIMLALIGLFGLSAFMAKGRTKEVGIRKVMGGSVVQLVNLLVWKFSKPVMWAILIAMPLAYFAAGMYLEFFAERINTQIPLIIAAGVISVGLSWAIIALHAYRVAKENPINALRYE